MTPETSARRPRGPRPSVAGAAIGVCDAISAVVEGVFRTVEQVRAAALQAIDANAQNGVAEHIAQNIAAEIDRTVRRLLLDPEQPVIGLGVVFEPHQAGPAGAPATVPTIEPQSGAAQQLRWWQVDPTAGSLQLLTPDLRPSSLGYYDYQAADWFTVPRRTGQRHVVGPYIDLNGTGQYLLTLTGPMMVGDRFVGVVGADVPVRRLEAHLMSGDGADAGEYVLLNDERRVVLSTSARWLVGELADGASVATAVMRDGCPVLGVPWTVHLVDA